MTRGYKYQFCIICIFLEILSGICPEFFLVFWNLSCPEFVQFYLSGICPEYFHVWNMSSFICPEFVQNFFMSRICLEKNSGIFHVQNLSSLFVQILSRFFSCLEYVQNLSGFLDMKNSRRSFFRTFSRHFLDMKKNSGQFPDNFITKFLLGRIMCQSTPSVDQRQKM